MSYGGYMGGSGHAYDPRPVLIAPRFQPLAFAIAAAENVFAWDASDYDWDRGPMSQAVFNAAKAEGVVCVTHKLTETAPGAEFYHTNFPTAMARAKTAGIPYRGAYIVPRSGVAMNTQVNNAVRRLDAAGLGNWRTDPKFLIQVDLEKWEYDAVSLFVGLAMADAFANIVGVKRTLVYASVGQYGVAWPSAYTRWNANYAPESSPSRDFRQVYTAVGGDAGRGWVGGTKIWQYASDTTIGGQPTCDANAFKGTLVDFAKLVGDVAVPPVVIPPPVPTQPPTVPVPPAGLPAWGGRTIRGVAVQPDVKVGPVGASLVSVLAYLPDRLRQEIVITSGYDSDHDPVSFHYENNAGIGVYPSGYPLGCAIDISARRDLGYTELERSRVMRDAAKWIFDRHRPRTTEEFHTTPFSDDNGFNIRDGNVVAGIPEHGDHVHWAVVKSNVDKIEALEGTLPTAKEIGNEIWNHDLGSEPGVQAAWAVVRKQANDTAALLAEVRSLNANVKALVDKLTPPTP